MAKMTADEKRWQAESDAHTMRRMAEMTPARQKEAKKILEQERKALDKAIGKKPPANAPKTQRKSGAKKASSTKTTAQNRSKKTTTKKR